MVEKLMQFFYSLKESDMENLDVFWKMECLTLRLKKVAMWIQS